MTPMEWLSLNSVTPYLLRPRRKYNVRNNPYVHALGFGTERQTYTGFGNAGATFLRKFWMTEGRRSQVVLLDERRLEILIQPKLYAGELLDIVASHFNLKEKEYFGLAYLDDTDHYNWLQLDHRVLEHDFPKKSNGAPLVLHFLVKFFVEGISQLRDSVTVEQFYLQAKSLIFKGQVEVSGDVAFDLAAHALQVAHGDYVDDCSSRSHLKKLPLLPSSFLKDQPSIAACEDKVICQYKSLIGRSRGSVIVSFMSIVEGLPTYGVHYFEVKDKSGNPWWLGLSHKGIAQYEQSNKKVATKVFQWKHLENLYFRDRKFSIEVHDTRRITHALSSFNLYEDAIEEPLDNFDELSDAITDPTTQVSVSRRTFAPGHVIVLVWFAANPILTKSIWSMAISQHQFYLDRKQSKVSSSTAACRLGEIASELSISRHSLSTGSSASNLSHSGSSQSLNANLPNGTIGEDTEQSEAAKAARLEMLAALKARKNALEEKLREKTDELRLMCMKEAEISGELPPEIPLNPGEPLPQIRRRVGTSFTLPENLINKLRSKEQEEDLPSLELDYAIQGKIVSAALKLANDSTASKKVRKQRKINHQQSVTKLKIIEQKLKVARHALNQKNQARGQIKKKQPRPSVSSSSDVGDSSRNRSLDEDSVFMPDAINLSGVGPPVSPGTPSSGKSSRIADGLDKHEQAMIPRSHSSASSTCTSLSQGAPSTPSSLHRPPPTPCSRNASPTSRHLAGGYIPNPIYTTRSSYRNERYPTLSTRSQRCHSEYDNISNGSSTSSGNFSPLYKNKYDAALPVESRGLYNVPMQRTSQAFQSQEELDELRDIQSSGGSSVNESHYRRHNTTALPQQRYGSLDRAFASTPHSARVPIDSRSMDNLDYPERSTNLSPAQDLLLPTGEYPLSPSPYDMPYRSEDVVDAIPPPPAAPLYSPNGPSVYRHVPNCNSFNSSSEVLALHRKSPERSASFGQFLSQKGYSTLEQQVHPPRTLSVPETLAPYHHSPNLSQPLQLPASSYHSPQLPTNSYHSPQPPTNSYHSPQPTNSYHSPHNLSQSSLAVAPSPPTSCTAESSPKVKEKEWYETCLDSPLPPRRLSCSSDRSPRSPTVMSTASPSPHKARKCLLTAPSPHGDMGNSRFSPSPSSCSGGGEPEGAVFLPVPFESPQNCTVVTMGQFQPYREETKPYELADYYKYSTKVRKQQQQHLENQCKANNNNGGKCISTNSLNNNHGSDSSSPVSPRSPRPAYLGLLPDELVFKSPQPTVFVSSPSVQRAAFINAHRGRDPGFQPKNANHTPPTQKHFPPVSPGCIGPDEAYNPHVGMAFMPPPQQLQGLYHPPRPMTCEPMQRSPHGTPITSPSTVRSNSLIKSRDNSFTLDPTTSLADDFHEEMLAWYEDQETAKQATLV